MKKYIMLGVALLVFASLQAQNITEADNQLINEGGAQTPMRVLQTTNPKDKMVLQTLSADVNLKDEMLPLLIQRMYSTVTDTLNPGVGIAAPQVGINKNVIWVQRFDKQGEPFEVYLNPKITWQSALLRKGPEGCLSIPDIRGDVLRSYTIRITYYDKDGKYHDEIVEGFTAVIFQHEIDHLLGILFTDRLEQQEQKHYTPINGEVNLFLEKPLKRQ
ncbi:peptide deformylase [Flavobacterium rhizosphaerae]|uniref:Peptide deformylase n=1 Tax=Flavobacterium rhizosphaerae TaxID=3163298 RepID=A0ABW8YRP7_9FLAO